MLIIKQIDMKKFLVCLRNKFKRIEIINLEFEIKLEVE